MSTGGHVEKDTVEEEKEGFDVEVLAPAETEVEEEFREAFVVDGGGVGEGGVGFIGFVDFLSFSVDFPIFESGLKGGFGFEIDD